MKRAGAPLLRNASAALSDVGDGMASFEFTSKMNALDADTLELLAREGPNFSVGANLGLALFALNVGLWDRLRSWSPGASRSTVR